MAILTIRLTQGTYELLLRSATAQMCAMKDVLEPAVKAYASRYFQLARKRQKPSKFPSPPSGPDSLILDKNHPRYRRRFTAPPRKLCTTVSDGVMTLLQKLAGGRAGIGDVAERALRFYLWDEQRPERDCFNEFIYPTIQFEDWKLLLTL